MFVRFVSENKLLTSPLMSETMSVEEGEKEPRAARERLLYGCFGSLPNCNTPTDAIHVLSWVCLDMLTVFLHLVHEQRDTVQEKIVTFMTKPTTSGIPGPRRRSHGAG